MKRNQKGHENAILEIYNKTIRGPQKLDLNKICNKHRICWLTGRSLVWAGHLKKMENGYYKWIGDTNPNIPVLVEEAAAYANNYKYGIKTKKVKKPITKSVSQPKSAVQPTRNKQQTIELAKKFAKHGEIEFANHLLDSIEAD